MLIIIFEDIDLQYDVNHKKDGFTVETYRPDLECVKAYDEKKKKCIAKNPATL